MTAMGGQAPAAPLRVASFNIRRGRSWEGRQTWWFRRAACASVIRSLDADVVGLQEVRPHQLRDLRRRVHDATIVGSGRDADGGGEHVSVLVRNGLTVESHETRWLSEAPTTAGSLGWDAGLPRIATFVRVSHEQRRLGIVNTHLDARGSVARTRAAELIAGWVQREHDRSWVVLGDFNDEAGSAPLRVFEAAGFVDALNGVTGGTEHAFTGVQDRRRIDHILVGPGIDVAAAHIDRTRPRGRLASDHWPVVADLLLTPV